MLILKKIAIAILTLPLLILGIFKTPSKPATPPVESQPSKALPIEMLIDDPNIEKVIPKKSQPIGSPEIAPSSTQAEYETALISDIDSQESSAISSTGKYQYKPTTPFNAQYASSYQVDELQYANGQKGYRILIQHYEDESIFNATTSKNEIVPVLKTKIITK